MAMTTLGPPAPPNSWLKRKFLSEGTHIIINVTSNFNYHYVKTEQNDQIERQGWLLTENYHHRWLQVVKHQHQQVNWLLVVGQIMLTTVCHSKIFITNLMTDKCDRSTKLISVEKFPSITSKQSSSHFSRARIWPMVIDHQLTLFHPRRSWTMWSSILRSRLTRPLVRLTSAFPIPPTRLSKRSVCLSVTKDSFRDVSAFANQCCSLLKSIHWESRRQKLTSTHRG